LERLDCSTNALNKLDVSANVNLTALRCYVNILPSLDISANTLLENLDCSSQKPFLDSNGANGYSFTNLNISGNAKLLDLNCSDNKLTTLNISTNTKLTSLDCSSNKIEALDVSNNTVLKKLLCNNNSLSALNLNNGNNIGITSFNASSNTDLSCIEVESLAVPATGWSKDSSAKYSLGCGIYVPDDSFENYLETHNKNGDPVTLGDATSMGDGSANNNYVLKSRIATVTNLNVSSLDINNLIGIEHFVALVTLNSSNNKLTFLELSNNTALTAIDCSSNSIKNLDFSANTALTSLLCNENELFSLSIKNGNNTNLIVLDASINSNLYCIDVDDKTTIGGTWVADAIASYGNDCKLGRLTTILDVNFEQALIDLGLDANLDGSVLTSNIEHLKSLDVNDTYISDLSGIRGFSSLTALECSGNNLDELDVSNMINLEFLNCNFNYLLTNDVAKTAGVLNIDGVNNLHRLSCANNFMTDLNISNLPNLKELDCRNNSIKTLDVTTNSKLKTLKCSHNSLLTLDVSQNTALEELNCDSNQIATITPENVSNSTLTKLSCSNNNLTELFLDNYIILESLSCGNNQITGIDLTANLALKTLDNSNNKIVDIDLVNNVNLQSLFCSNNEFSQLDLNTNVFLKTLDCSSNKITNLALNSNTLLKYLSVSDNQLSVLNLANNTNLVELDISLNVIEDLTLASDITALKTLNASKNKLAGALDLSGMGTAACPLNPNNPSDFCPTSISIDLSENALQFVNLKNGINAKISNFDTLNNPNLSCIEIDDVAAIGENWFKAAATEYSLNCHFGETYVPDDNFELALIALGYDSLPLDNYVSTSNIDALTSLDINGESITDLTGIQNFTALQTLVCSNNSLSILELKNNVALSQLDCSNNAFSAIDFSDNLALKTIDCSNNLLLNLNLSANSNLLHLNISNNSFSIFLPSEIPSLQDLNCDSNQLTMLDLSSNTALTALSCESNLLETLNIKNGQNSNLLRLNVQNNPDLTCIETDTGEEPNGVTWLKAATTTYQINCYYGQTFVPDNAFEQALINKGIDQGGLDDYVLTESINTISFLNISNNNIEDLTGIEDFKNLQNLNFSNNIVARLDVSKNILLKELHAANNLLLELDLVSNVALEVVNILGNSLEGINLDANINILELNVSNNQLSALDIAALVHLQNLDCSTNMLQSLSIALNVQLVNLYCQSNLFISDQLNLRNGVNSNLVNFNATDNSALICILVDDPFAVIENSVGTYDGWNKDSTANYQSVCLDADNDGVVNEDDDCPNSVFGQPVNLFGCEYLMLPNDNFTILTIGETCLNSNNGKIKITAVANFSYTATITSDSFEVPFSTEYKFSNDVEIRNLLAGSYKVCIAIQEWPDYTNCYAVVINQPEVLGVLTAKSSDNRKVLLDLSGNVNYNIDINGLKFTVNTNQLSLNLDKGENSIKVSTDLACQGIYEERIFVPNLPFVYPNPFSNQINISLGKSDANTRVHIQSSLGHSVYSKTFTSKESRALIIDTGLFSAGVYIISIKTIDSVSTFKIVKK
jgi:Leucine-rich repeat (LRR) protein